MGFATKADTLKSLEGVLETAALLPIEIFTVRDWHDDSDAVLDRLSGQLGSNSPLIVRSSAVNEDSLDSSLAGHFASVGDIETDAALRAAIETVIGSYGDQASEENQFFVQPMLRDVRMSGVAFGRDPNTGAPYHVVNYDDSSGSTTSVTGGNGEQLGTFYHHHDAPNTPANEVMGRVVRLLSELTGIFGTDAIDIEFAQDSEDQLVLLQARPLAALQTRPPALQDHADQLSEIAQKVETLSSPHPYLLGDRTMFGVMPDWNPAEIIGIRPRQLALSLYRELITDSIWAYQRDNYGYRNLRSFPLLVDFFGLPYVDVRVSFNSFIPKDIDQGLATRLVEHYMDRLSSAPVLHDKVEFEIVLSCYTLDLPARMSDLQKLDFSEADCETLSESLRQLTNNIIHEETGFWRSDLARIAELEKRQETIHTSGLGHTERIYWLLEDCKRYGTLPFAGLARAAFIAVQLLRSMVATGILTDAELNAYMASLSGVGSQIFRDFKSLSREAFLAKYGHLRPGTYDLASPRYDEAPDLYFDWESRHDAAAATPGDFDLTAAQLRSIDAVLAEQGLNHDANSLLTFIRNAIEGREYAKFVFTRSLSDALVLFGELGAAHGLTPDDCSHADIRVIRDMYLGCADTSALLAGSISTGRAMSAHSQQIVLPEIIARPEDVWSFHVPPSTPNFITLGTASGPIARDLETANGLAGAIVMIPSADPGYDWIFSHGIAGLITMYGGANSHMAIRAGEYGIPAVIGAGVQRFDAWGRARALTIDCRNRLVVPVDVPRLP